MTSAIEINPTSPAQATVIWLHGLGADGNDFVPVVPELQLPTELAIRFIFPHAPHRPVTINGGYVMRAWYDIVDAGFLRPEDKDGIHDSSRAVSAIIQRETDRGIASSRIVLAGFSQGGAIALHAGLRYEQPLAGILALSAYLPLADSLAEERHSENNTTPIMMAHGSEDSVVPIMLAEQSRQILKGLNYEVEWHHYPAMGHSVYPKEINDVSRWLQRVLG